MAAGLFNTPVALHEASVPLALQLLLQPSMALDTDEPAQGRNGACRAAVLKPTALMT
jgi:hypothetical protein